MNLRTEIPPEVAAELLFRSDRTCCVCRMRGRPVQIHHLDEDSSNHTPDNLAVLCFECHRDTQLKGGFDRKLESRQILLYRNDWYERVTRRREAAIIHNEETGPTEPAVRQPAPPRFSTSLRNYVNTLPGQRHAAYGEAQKVWDSGITSDMMNASHGLIHNLQSYLVGLASFYPRGHFGPSGVDEFFHEIIHSRFEWHRKHLEPEGFDSGGTIIDPIVSGNVIDDLENMITDMVRSLTQHDNDFNFTGWLTRWNEAA